ncbi:MAG TPA: DUF308 domain-containing protein [Chitinophagaceae bacterium]|nr:DUF308 domain-containing protein [Chitinophagaceae bacterium]
MLSTLLKKWWVILIQGILMIILAFLVINNPISTLAGISLTVATLVLLIGILGVIWWFSAPKDERETSTLIWSLVTTVIGLLMAAKLGITMLTVTVLFGIMLLANGYHLVKNGWANKELGAQAWLVIIVGILSLICGLMSVFNIGIGAVTISVVLGYQFLLAGIALIALAFLKKRLVKNVRTAVDNRKTGLTQ